MVRSNGKRWQIAVAKAKLSELLDAAREEPQTIERRGTPVAVVVAIDEYRAASERLLAASASEKMASFLRTCAALRAEGGVTLRLGRREARPSPFAEGRATERGA